MCVVYGCWSIGVGMVYEVNRVYTSISGMLRNYRVLDYGFY